LRLLNDADPLCESAEGYFRYFLQERIDMVISTISVAEYCCGGDISGLPLRNLQILPFNVNHGKRAGELARVAFQARREGSLVTKERLLIPNDTKLFAQADSEEYIQYYLSSDSESRKVCDFLASKLSVRFQFIDLRTPCNQTFGRLFGDR